MAEPRMLRRKGCVLALSVCRVTIPRGPVWSVFLPSACVPSFPCSRLCFYHRRIVSSCPGVEIAHGHHRVCEDGQTAMEHD